MLARYSGFVGVGVGVGVRDQAKPSHANLSPLELFCTKTQLSYAGLA
jgi:hypothetical protein